MAGKASKKKVESRRARPVARTVAAATATATATAMTKGGRPSSLVDTRIIYCGDSLEASNWPAEQAIRPAVVNRKVFGGNRTWIGAHALEVLASLFATCRQNDIDALDILGHLLRHPRPRPLLNPIVAP